MMARTPTIPPICRDLHGHRNNLQKYDHGNIKKQKETRAAVGGEEIQKEWE
jgi:hypothetical protein